MTYDLEEQEQLDALKAWWAKNGNLILGVLTVVLLAVASWQAWNWYQRDQAGKAAGYFDALQNAATQGNVDQAANASRTLRDDYGSTAYAPRGALVAAQAALAAGNTETARAELQWVVTERKDDPLAPVARIRLAGVLMDAGEFDAALELVADPAPAGFEGLYADRRGDILVVQGKREQARQAWQAALTHLDGSGSPMRSVVQLKIDALGGAAA